MLSKTMCWVDRHNFLFVLIVMAVMVVTTVVKASCPCDCELPYPAMVCYHTPDFGDCRDGIVGIDELLWVLRHWGDCRDSDIAVPGWLGPGGVGCEWGDIDRDGRIGFSDFLLVLEWWGPLDDQTWREWRCR